LIRIKAWNAETSSVAGMPDQGRLVHVVDADSAVRRSLQFSLEIEGFSVRTYPDATSFLKEADFAVPCIVVVDLNLPDITITKVLDALRERGGEIPAILTTSVASPALQKRIAVFNAPIVEKPFLGDELLDAIRAAFAR
jgi:two-component system response regulator FixJ